MLFYPSSKGVWGCFARASNPNPSVDLRQPGPGGDAKRRPEQHIRKMARVCSLFAERFVARFARRALFLYVCLFVRLFVCARVCACVRARVRVSVCACVRVCVCAPSKDPCAWPSPKPGAFSMIIHPRVRSRMGDRPGQSNTRAPAISN